MINEAIDRSRASMLVCVIVARIQPYLDGEKRLYDIVRPLWFWTTTNCDMCLTIIQVHQFAADQVLDMGFRIPGSEHLKSRQHKICHNLNRCYNKLA